jgi:hypothetical protein
MSGIYGSAWLSNFQTPQLLAMAKKEWGRALNDFSDEKIAQGIEHAVQSGATMPPTLPKFMSYVNGSTMHKLPAYRLFHREALPAPSASERTAAKALLTDIKLNLGG